MNKTKLNCKRGKGVFLLDLSGSLTTNIFINYGYSSSEVLE